MTVFSGHDTVIAPVLSALGIYRHPRFCRWPQYASRIIFEVYERKKTNNNNNNEVGTGMEQERMKSAILDYRKQSMNNNDFKGDLKSVLSVAEVKEILQENNFVRVLFNGEDVTPFIPTCVTEKESIALLIERNELLPSSSSFPSWVFHTFSGNFTLCSMRSFTKQIQNMISPHQTIEQACGW
jgi:hypothetical protein